MFEKYDRDNSGYIDQNEVASLLKDTYDGLGLGYSPNEQDVRSWLNTVDLSEDGLVSREEFVNYFRDALGNRGIA
jgi:Ca2+-binding EF-hand superfamily protein